jgi:hypothetical protein
VTSFGSFFVLLSISFCALRRTIQLSLQSGFLGREDFSYSWYALESNRNQRN